MLIIKIVWDEPRSSQTFTTGTQIQNSGLGQLVLYVTISDAAIAKLHGEDICGNPIILQS